MSLHVEWLVFVTPVSRGRGHGPCSLTSRNNAARRHARRRFAAMPRRGRGGAGGAPSSRSLERVFPDGSRPPARRHGPRCRTGALLPAEARAARGACRRRLAWMRPGAYPRCTAHRDCAASAVARRPLPPPPCGSAATGRAAAASSGRPAASTASRMRWCGC